MENTSYNIGSVILLDKVDANFGFSDAIFNGINVKSKNLKETAKLLMYNKLAKSSSINRIVDLYPQELFEQIGFKGEPKTRTIYRNLTRIGLDYPFILKNYQDLIKKYNLVSEKQFPDFSSTYFHGKKSEFSKLGYSRDHRPDKEQIVFGISTGMNAIPSALTIQKGNVSDKKHFKFMINTVKKVLDKNSMLIFDCGGNTKENKEKIEKLGFNYLTLMPKKRRTYKKYIDLFKQNTKEVVSFVCNERDYSCLKIKEKNVTKYLFFSKRLKEDQLSKRERKFQRELKKNKNKLVKTKQGKALNKYVTEEGYVLALGSLQRTLDQIKNPYITDLEGFFILESSVDDEPEKILKLYKNRDVSEKLIRDIKEGIELRPIRHWCKEAIIGYILISFLTNCIINLALYLKSKMPLNETNPLNKGVKNIKLLKKYLSNLTLTIVYPKNGFKFTILSNISPEIKEILGDFVYNYEDKSLKLRW